MAFPAYETWDAFFQNVTSAHVRGIASGGSFFEDQLVQRERHASRPVQRDGGRHRPPRGRRLRRVDAHLSQAGVNSEQYLKARALSPPAPPACCGGRGRRCLASSALRGFFSSSTTQGQRRPPRRDEQPARARLRTDDAMSRDWRLTVDRWVLSRVPERVLEFPRRSAPCRTSRRSSGRSAAARCRPRSAGCRARRRLPRGQIPRRCRTRRTARCRRPAGRGSPCRTRSCRRARRGQRAARAVVCGSTPCVLAPSVSKTTASAEYPATAFRFPLTRAPVGATEWSTCAIESSEVKIPWPIAVPNEVGQAAERALEQLAGVGRRGHQHHGGARERDQPDPRGPPPCDLMNPAAAHARRR